MNKLLKILIVDDTELLRLTLAIRFRGLGHHVVDFGSESETLEYLSGDPEFDVLITDLNINPDGNGIRLIREAKELLPDDAKICLMSGDLGKADVAAAISVGAQYTIHKPFLFNDLVQVLGI
ncbi:MAG: response regulator [Candidatus Paceibacterota bacterium]|jgi:CheY-like chemotaxis protein